MLPIIAAIGAISILSKLLLQESKSFKKETNNKKRIFVSFAIEDAEYRKFLVDQSKQPNSPFTFVDMSVKNPWPEDVWKDKCRTKIKRCHGMIVLLSKSTWHSSGTRWEVKCAKRVGIPVVGMQIKKNNPGAKLPELGSDEVIDWSWPNIQSVIDKF